MIVQSTVIAPGHAVRMIREADGGYRVDVLWGFVDFPGVESGIGYEDAARIFAECVQAERRRAATDRGSR